MSNGNNRCERRTALKGLAGGLTALTGAGIVGTPAAASHNVALDCYVYINSEPYYGDYYTNPVDRLAEDAETGLDNFFDDIERSGHCDMTHNIHSRWETQMDEGEYPAQTSNDIDEFQSWLREQNMTEGSQNGECAVHVLIRHVRGSDGGGVGSGQWPWPEDKGEWNNAIPCAVTNAGSQGDWNRFTVQHEVGHTMVDSSLSEIREMTHESVDECQHNDSDETIHHRDHTLGTVIDGGKTPMAHRSPSAAECTGDGNGSGVGGDNARGTGITPGRTSHAADKAFGISKREHS